MFYLSDILADFHVHSHWNYLSERGMIEKIAKKAMELGYLYIGISDHTKALGIERGLNEKQLAEQRKFIDNLNSKFKIPDSKFKILQGCEANILKNGSIDIDDEALAKLDYVIAGAHSFLAMPKEEMTERIIKAMKNPHVDIISHPTNRVVGHRAESSLDFDRLLKVAKETGTVLEINANPARLDLKASNIKKARAAGVKMIIGTDAHMVDQMDFMELGIKEANKGGAGKSDIVNTMSLEEVSAFFKKPKTERF